MALGWVGLQAVAGKGRSSKLFLWHDLLHDLQPREFALGGVTCLTEHRHHVIGTFCNVPIERSYTKDAGLFFLFLFLYLYILIYMSLFSVKIDVKLN